MKEPKLFLSTLFSELEDGEHICVSRATPKRDGSGNFFKNYTTAARQWRKWNPETQDQAWYFCVSTINGELNEKGTMVGRGRKHLVRYHCLVLDDIGTKAVAPPVEPSWKVETSPGSGQWGYYLDPGSDWGRYEALLDFCHRQGWGDAGAGGSYRLMRVPGSANLKPGRQLFHSVVTESDTTVWSLDELVADFGFDPSTVEPSAPSSALTDRPGGAIESRDGIDPLLDWLVDQGHVARDDGGEWVTIICPWADQHTTGENTAGYSPLGRGAGKYVQTRAFKCLHEHCKDRLLGKFREWSTKLGAPAVMGFDPLPWLQDKFVYVSTGQLVYDLHQRPRGGVWKWSLADFTKDHPGKVMPPGRDAPVTIATAFLEDDKTRKAVDTCYTPVSRHADTGMVEREGQKFLNVYVPPNWERTDEEPKVFLEHLEYVIPSEFERETFYNWLAHKIQNPAKRSYAVIMIAEGVYGTGRSWIGRLISKMLQGHVNKASLLQLIGKGTSAEMNYNSWMVECQFLICEEAKDTALSREDFWHGYDTFKQNVEPGDAGDAIRINDKYGRIYHEVVYHNPLIFTNHADAMVIEAGDRRIFCVENPTELRDYKYYDRLTASLQTQEPRRVYWWLMRRDLTTSPNGVPPFNHIYPPMTPSKARMIEDTQAPSDAIAEWIHDNHAPDLVTRATLKVAIVMAARDLDDERTNREPGNITKILWRKLKSMRPDDAKNGARYVIDGKQTEVRAIRGQSHWVDQDGSRDTELVLKELGKAAGATNVVDFRGA
jgi:hypothetical protein